MNESLWWLLPFIYKNHALPKLSKYETKSLPNELSCFSSPIFPGHRAFEWQRLGILASFCITGLLHAGHTEGWWLVVFSAQETLLHEITTGWHCRGNASKPFKIFASLKSQCDQCLRRLRVMATLEWTPSASCRQFTWSWTVQETPRVSTRNLFEFSVDYIVFPCISSRFAAVVNLWNHWDVKLLQRAFHGKNRNALTDVIV